jgi:HSP20 family molecular chaperone IbpA
MTNFFASVHQALNVLRRDLEDVFEEIPLPRRMRREVERLFDQASSPMWLWREMDQLLEEFMTPTMLRRRIFFIFDRVMSTMMMSQRGFNTREFPVGFGSSRGQFGGQRELGYPTNWGFRDFGGFVPTNWNLQGHGYPTNWNGVQSFGQYPTSWNSLQGHGYPIQGFGQYPTNWNGIQGFGQYPTNWNGIQSFGQYPTNWNSIQSFGQYPTNWNTFQNHYPTTGWNVREYGNTFGNSFGGFGSSFGGRFTEDFTPALELIERESDFLVRLDVPGVREQDVDTRITEEGILTIHGERRDDVKRTGGWNDVDPRFFGGTTWNNGFFNEGFNTFNGGFGTPWSSPLRARTEYSEQTYGSFTRSIALPRNIDPTRIQAMVRDGVLEVRIPKAHATSNRRVPVGRDDVRPIFRTNVNGEARHVS